MSSSPHLLVSHNAPLFEQEPFQFSAVHPDASLPDANRRQRAALD
jgi:hypothetical protein